MERSNGLKPGEVLSARWIKPAHRRTEGQIVGHAILGFTQLTGANAVIRGGLIIVGKRVWARKLLQEPRRCLKCQKMGTSHIATECKQDKETCGSCGNDHHTAECTITDPFQYSCVNCNEKGHAAWDRQCPSFIKSNAAFNARHPENGYRYFPTAMDPTSWEQLPGHIPYGPGETTSLQQQTYPAPGMEHRSSWAVVNRQQREVGTQGVNSRSRTNPANRGNAPRGTQRAGPATGVNAIPGPNNNNSSNRPLRQTTLSTGWAPRAQESANPAPTQ